MARCNCLGGVTIVTEQTCEEACANCFIPANYVVPVADRVDPCGGVHIINVDDLNNFSVSCTGNVFYQLYNYDTDAFTSVVITSNGVLTYTLSDQAVPGVYYSIVYRARCDNEQVGGYGVIQTTPKDLCLASNCTISQTCDKCTGDCVNIAVDLSINIQ